MSSGDFYSLVYDIVRRVPAGRVTTYGSIARCIGTGMSSRMVGFAMNKAPHDVPAHRVVNRNGLLTGKHAFGDPMRMQHLLESEGVEVLNDQVVQFLERLWDPMKELGDSENWPTDLI